MVPIFNYEVNRHKAPKPHQYACEMNNYYATGFIFSIYKIGAREKVHTSGVEGLGGSEGFRGSVSGFDGETMKFGLAMANLSRSGAGVFGSGKKYLSHLWTGSRGRRTWRARVRSSDPRGRRTP